jgi:hypothetical protein
MLSVDDGHEGFDAPDLGANMAGIHEPACVGEERHVQPFDPVATVKMEDRAVIDARHRLRIDRVVFLARRTFPHLS